MTNIISKNDKYSMLFKISFKNYYSNTKINFSLTKNLFLCIFNKICDLITNFII